MSELENVARRVTGSAFLAVHLIAVVTMRPVTSSLSGTVLQTYLKNAATLKSKDKLELMCLNSASCVLKEVELAGTGKRL